jgi:hypothetical protein
MPCGQQRVTGYAGRCRFHKIRLFYLGSFGRAPAKQPGPFLLTKSRECRSRGLLSRYNLTESADGGKNGSSAWRSPVLGVHHYRRTLALCGVRTGIRAKGRYNWLRHCCRSRAHRMGASLHPRRS